MTWSILSIFVDILVYVTKLGSLKQGALDIIFLYSVKKRN